MEKEEISIRVTIAGRTYPLTIKMEEEEAVRKAAQRVNEKVQELEEQYAVQDSKDLLAMTALEMATKGIQEEKAKEEDQTEKELSELENRISQYLQRQEP